MNLNACTKINYGVYIVSSVNSGHFNGHIANTVFQVTAEPPQIAISINKDNLTHGHITASGVFSISVISQDAPIEFIGKFGFKSGRDIDKFASTKHTLGYKGLPIVLDYTLATFELEVTNKMDIGTHTIFTGKIINCDVISESEPMTYSYYHKIKKGLSPKSAPTYIKTQNEQPGEVSNVKKYRCTICNYIYDPEKGDPDSGIKPGTAFEAIPDTWSCPICGAGKSAFVPA